MTAVDPDLSAFKARGGKLLIYHGWNDGGSGGAISPLNTLDYFGCAYFTTTHNRPQICDLHPLGYLGVRTKHGDMKISWVFAQREERLEGSLASFPRA